MRDVIRKRLRAKKVGKHRRRVNDLALIEFFANQRDLTIEYRRDRKAQHRKGKQPEDRME